MDSNEYQVVIAVCMGALLILSPLAGILRAVRRLRSKAESQVAPFLAVGAVVADAVAGLTGFFGSTVALAIVLLSVIWLLAALGANALGRRARTRAEKSLATSADGPAAP